MYNILFVTNDVLMIDAIKVIVSENEQFRLLDIVTNGDDAIKLCKSEIVNIVLFDMEIEGNHIINHVRSINYLNPEIHIYVISCFGINKMIWHDCRNYIKNVIEKPINYKLIKKIFYEYKAENENSLQAHINDLTGFVLDNDYKKFYFEYANIIDKIYDTVEQDGAKLVKVFKYIANRLVDIRNFYAESIDIIEIFPISENMIMDKKVADVWLFKVMDYLFQRRCIDRYNFSDDIFIYIDKHLKEKITLKDVTSHCAISQGYLSRIFREQLNISVMEYLHMKKINMAKAYFYFTSDTVEAVAFKLGYNESSYFSKVFKKYSMQTVKEYRLKNK
ncbi:MAG: AraC family transcriptional regulator [Lachnospirales bacterium]